MAISVLIADDHTLLRAGLRSMLAPEPDVEVIGEAAGGEEALALAFRLQPDIVLADISMPGPNGIELASRLSHELPGTRVLVLTMHEDADLVREAMAAGAKGYIIKRAAEAELVEAIRVVANNGEYVHPEMQRAAEALAPAGEGSPAEDIHLDPAEARLICLFAQGATYREIAAALHISEYAAEVRCGALMEKLDLRMRTEFAIFAREHGLL